MQATALIEKKPPIAPKKAAPQPRSPRKISWPEFQKRYLEREDSFKYEWVNGEAIKTERMENEQIFIVRNLMSFFRKLANSGASGELLAEIDAFFGPNHRRPDLGYFTEEQIALSAYKINQAPLFAIEIASNNDQIQKFSEKIGNYRDAGVRVVWLILPKTEEVHVYAGKNLKQITVCSGDDICSAEPVFASFEMAARAIFQKPPRPV